MNLDQFLIEPDQMPTMPHVIVKALNTIKDEYTGIKELSKIISCDQSLSTKILTLVNSAHYSLPNKIISINKAVGLIGMNQAKNIIISIAMKSIYSDGKEKDIWSHSIRCAVCCEHLATEFKVMSPDEAFMLGFLHDIGKTMLNKQNPQLYSKVLDLERRGLSSTEAEEMYFKTNHANIGFYIATQWEFSEVIANAIKYHHNPLKSPMEAAAALVHYSDQLSKETVDDPAFDPEIARTTKIFIKDYFSYKRIIEEKTNQLLSTLSAC